MIKKAKIPKIIVPRMIFRRVRSLPNAFWKIPRITQIDIIAASILNKNIIGPRIMPLFEMQFKRVLSIDNRVSVTPILLIILCGVSSQKIL